MMRRAAAAALAGMVLLTFPAWAQETVDSPGSVAATPPAIDTPHDQASARQAAERAADLDRLITHMAALEHDNDELRTANGKLTADLDEVLRKLARLESENDALAELAAAKLDDILAAGRQLASARGELDRVSQLLTDLQAGRAVLTAVAQDMPLLVATGTAAEHRSDLEVQLDEARARIRALEAERR